MENYFYDNPMKAIIKAGLLLFTYISSILFKTFTIEIVLPTVFLFFLTNIYDYGELAFAQNSKSKRIRNSSLIIFVFFLFSIVVTFCIYTTDNQNVISVVDKYYIAFYIMSAIVWLIPLFDGIRGRLDLNCKDAENIVKSYQSDIAYGVMVETFDTIK